MPLNPTAAKASDPSHDFLRSEPRPLDALFQPTRVAVIGATEREGSVGRTVLQNLLNRSFQGKVYPVHPTRRQILGHAAYANIAAVPEKVDLAVVITPAATAPDVIGDCVDAGVRAAVVISAILVSDLYQRHGLRFELMRRLTQIARDEKLERVAGNILPENREMQGLARKAGFELRMDPDQPLYTAVLKL